jgi:hypothetical protein
MISLLYDPTIPFLIIFEWYSSYVHARNGMWFCMHFVANYCRWNVADALSGSDVLRAALVLESDSNSASSPVSVNGCLRSHATSMLMCSELET